MANSDEDLIWSDSNAVQGQYLELLQSGTLSDAEVRCGKRTWKVHKVILCARSEWFKKAFIGPFKEAETGIVNITEFEENEVDCLLCYIYTGKIHVDKYFPGKAKMTASIPIWKMGDFFCLEDLCMVGLKGRDVLFQKLSGSYSTLDSADAFPPEQVSNIIHLVQEVYKEDRNDVRQAFISPLLVFLLSAIHILAKTDRFMDLLLKMPEFASDWAKILTSGIGSIKMPDCSKEKCSRCFKKQRPMQINRFKLIREQKAEVFCSQCFPVQRLEDWVGKSCGGSRPPSRFVKAKPSKSS